MTDIEKFLVSAIDTDLRRWGYVNMYGSSTGGAHGGYCDLLESTIGRATTLIQAEKVVHPELSQETVRQLLDMCTTLYVAHYINYNDVSIFDVAVSFKMMADDNKWEINEEGLY